MPDTTNQDTQSGIFHRAECRATSYSSKKTTALSYATNVLFLNIRYIQVSRIFCKIRMMRLSICSLDCRNIDICETRRLILSNYGQRKGLRSSSPTKGRLLTTVKAMKRKDSVPERMQSGDIHISYREVRDSLHN